MSLLSTDITKVKRLSLRGVKLQAQEIDKPKLIALAQRVIEREKSYSREEIIERLKEATNLNQERDFNIILQAGAIEVTLDNRYYLTGSTPF